MMNSRVVFRVTALFLVTLSTFDVKWLTAATSGCCPAIDKNHSVIQAFGYQCSAAITVSAGNCSDKDNFLSIVRWGDRKSTEHKSQLGPFQYQHSYHQQPAFYVVTAEYCSVGDGKPEDSCCDSISKKIAIPATL